MTNLKNRPRFGKAIRTESAIAFNQQYEEWFEAFEKKMRPFMTKHPRAIEWCKENTAFTEVAIEIVAAAIRKFVEKEVFGE